MPHPLQMVTWTYRTTTLVTVSAGTRQAEASTVVVVEGRRRLLRAGVVGGIGGRREPARREPAAQKPEHEWDVHAAEPSGKSTADGKTADR